MNKTLLTLGLVLLTGACANQQERKLAPASEPMLAHNVVFSLKDKSDAAHKKFVDSCYKLLGDIPGIVFFTAGPRAKEFNRPVNLVNFDVGLHIIFKNKQAHDQYQISQKHQQFINENESNIDRVRVYDTYVR